MNGAEGERIGQIAQLNEQIQGFLDVSLVNLFLWSDLMCIPDLVLTLLQSPLYCELTLTFACLPQWHRRPQGVVAGPFE